MFQWRNQSLARAVTQVESEKLANCLPDLNGPFLLQYSALSELVVESSTLEHHFVASEQFKNQLQMNYQQLPFRDNCLDCVVTHHVLDFNSSPHQCLREAARVVVPNGYLVVVGFNPWSLWGGGRILSHSMLPKGGKHLSRARVIDWLTLLGFRVEHSESTLFMPPRALCYLPAVSSKVNSFLSYIRAPFGGVYVLVARKLVAGRTPVRPQWRVLGGRRFPVVSPSTRGARVVGR